MLSGLKISPYDPSNGIFDLKLQNTRTYDNCLKASSLSHRLKHCSLLHSSSKAEIPACMKLLNYCGSCCDQEVDNWEKVLHWGCVKGCVGVTRRKEKELRK
jgi:hypothetical protein